MSRDAGQLARESLSNEKDTECTFFSVDRKYIFAKMFYFFYFAGLGAVLPYQPLFYKEIGIPAKKAGIISGIQPFVSFLFTPVWGAIADKFQKGRSIFVMSFVALVAVGIAYLLTPLPDCKETNRSTDLRAMPWTGNISIVYKFSQTIIHSHDLDGWPLETKEPKTSLESRQSQRRDKEKTFDVFLYLLLVCLFGTLFSCPGLALGDAAAVCLLGKNNEVHKYGKQKRWASIGWGMAAFSFGAIVSDNYLCPDTQGHKGEIDYSVCFYGSIALKMLALISGLQLGFNMNENNVEKSHGKSEEEKRGVEAALKAIRRPHYFAFFLIVLYCGMTFGMIMGFFFWHLKDNCAPQILFSIIPVIRCIADVFVYTISPRVITQIGVHSFIYLILVGYVIRLACFMLINSPWVFIAIESLSGLTSAGAWAAFVAYIACHSVEGAPATLQGI